MRFARRRLLAFIAWFLPIFAVLLALYPFVVRLYEPAVLETANFVMRRLDPPTEMGNDRSGRWQGFNVERGLRRPYVVWPAGVKHLHFLSLALLPALLLATPAPWRVRLRLLAIALPLLFVAHTLAIIGIARGQLCLLLDLRDLPCRIRLRIASMSGQLFGTALWALLTFRYWFERERAPESLAAPEPDPERPPAPDESREGPGTVSGVDPGASRPER